MLAAYGGGPVGAFCSVREMRSRIATIATTTAIPIPIARQLVSRSSTVGFGWMNPPMQGLYYSLRLHHRDTEAQRNREILCLVLFKNCHSERSEEPAVHSGVQEEIPH